jgi:DNA invertase Pin-like site-specific DNA recombinase
MKYFIYTRKSTDSEERQVLSIESQISELKEFAAKEKLEIVQSERVASAGGIPPTPPFRPPYKFWANFADFAKMALSE